MATRTNSWPTTVAFGEEATAAKVSTIPGGWLGYALGTTSQTNITTETALTSMSVSVTIPANRVIFVSAAVQATGSVGGDNCRLRLYIDGVETYSNDLQLDTTRQSVQLPKIPMDSIAAGVHTFHLTMARVTGSGDVDTGAPGHPLVLLIEDGGPV